MYKLFFACLVVCIVPFASAVTPLGGGGGGGPSGSCESVRFSAQTGEPAEAAAFSILDHEHEFTLLSCSFYEATCTAEFDGEAVVFVEGETLPIADGELTFLLYDTADFGAETEQARFLYHECQATPEVPEFSFLGVLTLGVIGAALVFAKKN